MHNSLYNATVTGKILVTPDLMILRVKTDQPRTEFAAGQYTSIGLYGSEKRSLNSIEPTYNSGSEELIVRPYSIASANTDTSDFEFYVSQVKTGQLTPRLFRLSQGSRMWVDDRILGIFDLDSVPSDHNIVMVATGTGLAPYICFLRSYITERKQTKMAVMHGAACPWDLGYYSELKFIESAFSNFTYLPTLLKADDTWTGLKGHIEDHLKSGILTDKSGINLDPQKTHFFLCGNPRMVESVSDYLTALGYKRHSADAPGALHIEEY